MAQAAAGLNGVRKHAPDRIMATFVDRQGDQPMRSGRRVIIMHAYFSTHYLRDVLRVRFPDGLVLTVLPEELEDGQ